MNNKCYEIVGERGLEPPWDYSHTALNRARLPISPLARKETHKKTHHRLMLKRRYLRFKSVKK